MKREYGIEVPRWEVRRFHQLTCEKGKSMAIVFVGIDLAKNVFAVHAVDEHGKPALVRPAVPRAKLHELIASLPPCTIAMEACSGGAPLGARCSPGTATPCALIAPKFVAPYRMSGVRGKNDAADAAAICEAVQRPAMRFVPVEVHRPAGPADGAPRTPRFRRGPHRQINRVRGLLSRAGHRAAAEGRHRAPRGRAPAWKSCRAGPTPSSAICLSELHQLDERIAQYDMHIQAIARDDERAKR